MSLGYLGVAKVENSSLLYCYKDKAGQQVAETANIERGKKRERGIYVMMIY